MTQDIAEDAASHDPAAPLDGDAETLAAVAPGTKATVGKTRALEFCLVLAGGVIGTLARGLITVTVGKAIDHGFPYDIALINVTGALGLGILAGWRDPHSRAHELLWLAMAVGFFGAYTTFSSFALGIVTLAVSGQTLLMLYYIAGSLALGYLAVELGLVAGARLRARSS